MMFFKKRGDGIVPSENKSHLPKPLFVILLSIIAVGGIVTSGILYTKYKKVQSTLNNPGVAGQIEAQDLVKKVSRLMLLPDGELPTVATVSDENKLKDQQFFHNTQNGDKLLIYTNSKLAVLYNPKSDKIVSVGPLNLEQAKAQVAGDSTEIKIAIYNGTPTSGLARSYQEEIKNKISQASISSVGDAKSKNVEKTFIVDLSGSKSQQAQSIAKSLGIEVGTLPDGEAKPNADFLVLVGKDKDLKPESPSPSPSP